MWFYSCLFIYLSFQAVSLISVYLDVPLRYPLRFGVSRSHIYDYAPPIENASSDLVANPASSSMSSKPIEFPLFLDGQDTTRAAYAIFLLNKVHLLCFYFPLYVF